jgi:hypothetical protein
MSVLFSARAAGAVGVVSLALITAALITFPSFPTTGAALSTKTPAVTVNRALKGDRQPIGQPEQLSAPAPVPSQARVPVGCDAAFSPVATPSMAHVFGRCTV